MKTKIKLFAALLFTTLLCSCGSSIDDGVPPESLFNYVIKHCAYERDAFLGMSLRNRSEVDNYIEQYAHSYLKEFGEEVDWQEDALINLLKSYDSRYFRDRGLIIKCFANSADLNHKVDCVFVDPETGMLNVDLATQINSQQIEYSYIVIECTLTDTKRDVLWNLDFYYYDE